MCNGSSPNQTTWGRNPPARAAAIADGFGDYIVPILENPVGIIAADFQQLAMHMQQLAAAGALVEVVDVLGDEQEFALVFALEAGQRPMGGIGLDARHLQMLSALVVKLVNQMRVAGESLGRGNILDAMFLPQAVGGAEGADARLGGNAGAGQHDDGTVTRSHERQFCLLAGIMRH